MATSGGWSFQHMDLKISELKYGGTGECWAIEIYGEIALETQKTCMTTIQHTVENTVYNLMTSNSVATVIPLREEHSTGCELKQKYKKGLSICPLINKTLQLTNLHGLRFKTRHHSITIWHCNLSNSSYLNFKCVNCHLIIFNIYSSIIFNYFFTCGGGGWGGRRGKEVLESEFLLLFIIIILFIHFTVVL